MSYSGSQVIEENGYDGYDRVIRQQKFDTAGTPTFTRSQVFDLFDRVTTQHEKVGTANSIGTRYTFVGLADQVATEEEKDTDLLSVGPPIDEERTTAANSPTVVIQDT